MTRTFGIPGDLPRMRALQAALGIGRLRPHSAESLASRLDYMDDCMQFGICPDSKGERHVENGRVGYDTVPLPEELEPHKQDLGTCLSACHRMLDSGDLEAAREGLKGIEALVEDMKERAAKPAHQLVRDTLKRRINAGHARKGKLKDTTKEALKLLALGRNIEQVCAQVEATPKLTPDNVRQIRRRYGNRA